MSLKGTPSRIHNIEVLLATTMTPTTGDNPTQTKVRTIAKRRTKDKSNHLRSVLRLKGRALLPGPRCLNARCKIYRVLIRTRTTNARGPRLTTQRGRSRTQSAINAMERDEYWTTILESTSKYWARALQGISITE